MIPRMTYSDVCLDPRFRFHIVFGYFGGSSWEMHTHDFSELVIVRYGNGIHVTEDEKYPLIGGDVFYVNPGAAHAYNDIDGLNICNIIFDPVIFLGMNPELQRLPGYHALFHLEPLLRAEHQFTSKLHLGPVEMGRASNLIELMKKEYEAQMPGYEATVRAYFTLLVDHLARHYAGEEATTSRELMGLSRVVSYIECNYSDPITLPTICDVACMSKSRLMRAFQHCYGTSPIDYLIQYRLKKACELLDQEEHSITEVAYDVGFRDSNYFSRMFRAAFGVTPRDYRKRRQEHLVF